MRSIMSTRISLPVKAAIGPEVMARFDAHVRREKRNMKMAKEAR